MSEMHESSGGEHSKVTSYSFRRALATPDTLQSRESWAMLRHGWVPPFLEEEDYYQWRSWHHYLDQVDDLRRHRKGYEFKARAKQLANLYVEELYMRDMMYWQKDVYGGTSMPLRDNLALLAQHCPDPYFPKEKHNLAWLLKRHRSVASLRELYKKDC
ncbi:hypothetical protein BDQ17DRAFT_411084 [Cyathus striatus]|nr:hypothetical protein BDQ17DRAFT_411084 [Cyathus striatus]